MQLKAEHGVAGAQPLLEEARMALKEYLERVLRDAATYTEHARRRTVTSGDIVRAVRKQGQTLYGYDHYDAYK